MPKIETNFAENVYFLKRVFLIPQKLPFDCFELLEWYGTPLKQAYDEILAPCMDPRVSDKKYKKLAFF